MDRFRSVELESSLSLFEYHQKRLRSRMAVSLHRDLEAPRQRVRCGFSSCHLTTEGQKYDRLDHVNLEPTFWSRIAVQRLSKSSVMLSLTSAGASLVSSRRTRTAA